MEMKRRRGRMAGTPARNRLGGWARWGGTAAAMVRAVATARARVGDRTQGGRAFCAARGDGLCTVSAPPATAGVAVIETGARSDDDLVDAMERLLPRDDRYRHAHGSPGHGADHVLPAIVAPTLVVPVQRGDLLLAVWQTVVLVDLTLANPPRHG